jgi:hypothetical protein
MNEIFYHVTSTLHLPWIIASGELRPSPNVDVGIGPTNFLWATTKRDGDKTSGAAWLVKYLEAEWPEELFGLVRLTLPTEGFLTSDEVIRREGWTAAAVTRLFADDCLRIGENDHAQWRCRDDPLPLANVLKVEARSYESPLVPPRGHSHAGASRSAKAHRFFNCDTRHLRRVRA